MKTLLAFVVLFTSAAAYAGDSGCGLGGLIISKNSKGLQLFSLTTNASFSSQPLGITSGTSGCSSQGLVSNDREMEYFVEVNNDDLVREMARGEGEKLQVLAQLNGCREAQSQKAFARMTKDSFAQIYPSSQEKPQDVIHHIQNEMNGHSDLQKSCGLASL